jgi:hypothetical protein
MATQIDHQIDSVLLATSIEDRSPASAGPLSVPTAEYAARSMTSDIYRSQFRLWSELWEFRYTLAEYGRSIPMCVAINFIINAHR